MVSELCFSLENTRLYLIKRGRARLSKQGKKQYLLAREYIHQTVRCRVYLHPPSNLREQQNKITNGVQNVGNGIRVVQMLMVSLPPFPNINTSAWTS